MINRIVINMPLPIKVGVSFFRRREKFEIVPTQVGFSFDNQMMYNFRENNDFKTDSSDKDLKEWHKQHGQDRFFAEMLIGAYQSYCMHNRIKPIKLKKFRLGLMNLSEEDSLKLVKLWQKSMSYGHADLPGKKKAKVKV